MLWVKELRKALSLMIITMLVCSTCIVFMSEVKCALLTCHFMGTVTGKDLQSNNITIQTEYHFDGNEWTPYVYTLEGTAPNIDAVNMINISDCVEAGSFGNLAWNTPEDGWWSQSWVAIGKMNSSTEKVITDIYGDPAFLFYFYEAYGDPSSVPYVPLLGNYKIEYENAPNCSTWPGVPVCVCEAKYTDIIILKEENQVDSHRLYPSQNHVYFGEIYLTNVTFHSGQAPVYPECTDQLCIGPQPISNFTIFCTVIPEFPSLIILPLFMAATLLAAIAYRRKETNFYHLIEA